MNDTPINTDRAAAAEYIAALSLNLAQMARRFGYPELARILEMASLEASDRAKEG